MNILEFCDITLVNLEIYHTPDASSKFIAHFKIPFGKCFLKESASDIMARYPAGYGETPETAIKNFCIKLKDYKFLVTEDSSENRRTISLPSKLEF